MLAESRLTPTDAEVDRAVLVIASLIAGPRPTGTIKSVLLSAIEDQRLVSEMQVFAAYVAATWE